MSEQFVPSYESYATVEKITADIAAEKEANLNKYNKEVEAIVVELAKKIDALLKNPVWSSNKTIHNNSSSNSIIRSPYFLIEAHQANQFENYLINTPIIVCYNPYNANTDIINIILSKLAEIFDKLEAIVYTFLSGKTGLIIRYPSAKKIDTIVGATGPKGAWEVESSKTTGATGPVGPLSATAITQTHDDSIENAKSQAKHMIHNVPKQILDYAELLNSKKQNNIAAFVKTMGVNEMTDIEYIDFLHNIGTKKYDYLKNYIVDGKFDADANVPGLSGPLADDDKTDFNNGVFHWV